MFKKCVGIYTKKSYSDEGRSTPVNQEMLIKNSNPRIKSTSFKIQLVIFLSLFSAISCGKASQGKSNRELQIDGNSSLEICDSKEDSDATMKVQIGDSLDWFTDDQLHNLSQFRNASKVGQFIIEDRWTSCTAFLVGKNHIITNNHCVGSQSELGNAKFKMRERGMQSQTYSCNKLLATDKRLDFSLLECSGNPGLEHGYLKLSQRVPKSAEKIYLTQINCNYIEDPSCSADRYTSYGTITKSAPTIIDHRADTLAGSSGSPIFSVATNELIALHNAGISARAGKKETNFGIPMAKIVQKIKSKVPGFSFASNSYSPNSEDDRIKYCR